MKHRKPAEAPLFRSTVLPLDTLFFFLLFSGPPTFRIRDSDASLYGEIDIAIVLQLLVWVLAGLWVGYCLYRVRAIRTFTVSRVHVSGIALIVLLACSTIVSLAPPLTAVKVYQIAVEFLFTWLFVERYGYEKTLRRILWASAILCLAIALGALVAPEFVSDISETGSYRLRGGIAGTNSVSAFALILLIVIRKRRLGLQGAVGFLFFAVLQFLSLTRASWVALAVVFAITAIKRPRIQGLRWVYASIIVGMITLMAGGLAQLGKFRDPDSVYDLSDRLGLWTYMSDAVLSQSPWFGLGYTAATRQLGLEFHPDLGSGHSMFFDVFIGGGIVSLTAFGTLLFALGIYASKLLRQTDDSYAFAACCLLLYILIMGSVGESIDTGPFGFTFWTLVSLLPLLSRAFLPEHTSAETGTHGLLPQRLQHLRPNLGSIGNPHPQN